ncbi:ABC transporter permease [Cohnella lubricantis]|uniref:ABC transporter permease n=1 Tax=Cohnella lubricantis TaxID=2163172 RepID=A0A841T6L2_9BACL|nr:ABC transporter permease [Cohnella lubricantis]MBB6676974.1 ABC transporter permease [Cohnella lubricantis]MBP2118379.1 ABC-2 type transport system permease protein [Cohnella lubricantis]
MVFSLAVKEWKLLLKEKGTFFWLLLLPILFIVLFGSVFGNLGETKVSLPYIDLDQSQASRSFLASLEQKGGYALEEKNESQLDDLLSRIRGGKASALLVLPDGFADDLKGGSEAQASVELYEDATSQVVQPLRSTLENIASGMRESNIEDELRAAGLNVGQIDQAMTAPLRIEDKPQNVQSTNSLTQIVPGYTVMFVFFIIISMIRRFLGDKSSGITARLRTTRMSPLSYLLGMWLAYLVVAVIQCAILLTFGHFVYGMPLGDVVAAAAVVLVLAVCGTGIGLAVCMIVRGENQGIGITQLIALGGAVLGGLWFPIEYLPKTMQTISHFIPQYWAQKAFQDIMTREAHLSAVLPSLAALLGFAALGLLVALARFRGFMKSALD